MSQRTQEQCGFMHAQGMNQVHVAPPITTPKNNSINGFEWIPCTQKHSTPTPRPAESWALDLDPGSGGETAQP